MVTLLTVFALPIATIILAIVLEKILRCPFLTALSFFAIYLIVAFSVFDASFLVFVIIYTILAFVTALIAEFFFRRFMNQSPCNRRCSLNNSCQNNSTNNNLQSDVNIVNLSNRDINAIANQIVNLQNGNRASCCCRR